MHTPLRRTSGRALPTALRFYLLASLSFCITAAQAITIQLDYTFDTSNHFGSGSAERARLEEASGFFEGILEDDLDAITPTGIYSAFIPESWQVNFTNPSTGGAQTVDDLVVPADTIIIYVGARSISGGIAEGGFGGASTFAFPGSAFEDAVNTRGETGVGTTDFAPWGGFISVDTGTTWDTTSAGDGGSNQHLLSTLQHEIGHVLGIGVAGSWDAQVNGSNEFTGTESVADYGGNVPLHFSSGTGRYDHWAEGTTSDIYLTSTSSEASLDPTIAAGTLKPPTYLDIAGLDDIGWDIAAPPVPEPSHLALLMLGALLLLRRQR